MDWRQFQNLYNSLKGLGRQRLIALGAAGFLVFALISIGSYFASRSGFETLYVGLTPPDISSMGRVLSEAGIPFEASTDGTKLGVPIGQAEQARALLAEKGLPGSPNAGYELFDKLGALGLTSFMQEVTRVRALEGELARTIQYLKGIRAARVHLFLPEQNALRTSKEAPTASVVIRTDVAGDATAAPAIKHLVAAAIPDMKPNEVQVIGTDGSILGGGNDTSAGDVPVQMLDLERTVSKQVRDSVRRALAPYLGIENFEVSAIARLNIDKHQTSQTKYDPDSKVERSTRVIKEAQSSSDGSGKSDVSVDQNIPNQDQAASKPEKKRAQDRKEETTNYEISSSSASTTSQGYKIDNVSLAVVVNKKRLAEIIGKDAKPEDIDKQVAEIQKVALSAAGLDTKRGDHISVAAVDFAPSPLGDTQNSSVDWTAMLLALAGTSIKSLTILLVAAIVVMAGFRPVMRTLLNGAAPAAIEGNASMAALAGPSIPEGSSAAPLDMPEMASPLLEPGANPFETDFSASGFAGGGLSLGRSLAFGPVEKLGAIIDRDEEQATAIMKHWVKNG
ncbi:flagellar basal-body MS-ring/collar protein FliF [Hyphomicrobium sp.]|jgi:flagellar M-ring protein FliF|uniref:flagellar basal-body MS-ring/collar protein FliF n=1 Tax=Hyphomicrobium sp. TaxID=82 RepID=UPI002C00FA94|nr:flagellar basal-body MS-ring/collar protein FliF [Hyphomicrobium sp.]HVZ04388.1 flagellar basal-body MS-ring/collar protein FliF [Hyphomicrobium sp.]